MTNEDLFRFHAGCKEVGNLHGVKFAYAVVRNLRIVGTICDDLRKATMPDDSYKDYDVARVALVKEHAAKDSDGKTIMMPSGVEAVIADQAAFDVAVAALQASHADAVATQNKKIAEFKALLLEPADVKLYTIHPDLLPAEITVGQLASIIEMIEE